MRTHTQDNENIIFSGGFESGLGIYRGGKRVAIVPECTYWDDDHIRVINRDGEAFMQSERREYSGTRSFGTNEWADIRSLGPVAGLTRSGYDEDGIHNVHLHSNNPLV
jgi:hypothetical protein